MLDFHEKKISFIKQNKQSLLISPILQTVQILTLGLLFVTTAVISAKLINVFNLKSMNSH